MWVKSIRHASDVIFVLKVQGISITRCLEAAALEMIFVKLHDQIYPISVADTFDPHLRTSRLNLVRPDTDFLTPRCWDLGADVCQ